MKSFHTLFEAGEHRWLVLHGDDAKKPDLLDSNEYIITHKGKHLLLDPGGFEIFPTVLSALVQLIEPNDVEAVFASHQDPDIASSFSLWQELNPKIKCYTSWLWQSFLPHFGGTAETFLPIEDKGAVIELNGLNLQAIPAHHMHSAGNFHLYDPEAKLLFTGDTGAAFIPEGEGYLFVDKFDDHIPYIEYFHRRWFGSNDAKNAWCDRVRELEIKALCPQHGAIYTGENVKRFIDWLRALNVGQASNTGAKL